MTVKFPSQVNIHKLFVHISKTEVNVCIALEHGSKRRNYNNNNNLDHSSDNIIKYYNNSLRIKNY